MRLRILTVGGDKEPWLREALSVFEKKISHYAKFEFIQLKASGHARSRAHDKREKESQQLLDRLTDRDYVMLFDEKGAVYDSLVFSQRLVHAAGGAHATVSLVIGGAFGASEALRSRSHEIWSLSELTLSHHITQAVVLEQVYRALTLWKGIPYHNA